MYAATQVLQKCLSSAFAGMHLKRVHALLGAVSALLASRRLVLMELARSWPGATRVRAPLKKLDRLLSNPHLQQERLGVYRAMARCLLKGMAQPLIVIDWADLQAHGRGFLLRAALPVGGRTLTLLECVYGPAQKQKRCTHEEFLQQLKAALPETVRPILISDAGFKRSWFQAVQRLGWHYVGRLRAELSLQFEGQTRWWKIQALYQKATATAQRYRNARLARSRADDGFRCDLVLWRRAPQGRVRLNHHGRRCRHSTSLDAARREKEPWVLASSLSLRQFSPGAVVKMYQKRMQIEESFRDLKCVRYGCGFDLSLTRSCARLAILLLIHALASFLAYLASHSIQDRHAMSTYGGVSSARSRRHYSLQRLGWLALRAGDARTRPRRLLRVYHALHLHHALLEPLA